jgi:hypothetical protein
MIIIPASHTEKISDVKQGSEDGILPARGSFVDFLHSL